MAKRDKKDIEFLSTQSYPGREVESLGLVVEILTVGLGTFRDYIARIMDILGGRVSTYDKPARKAMEKVFDGLQDQAWELGADAVIGVVVEVSPVPFKGIAMTQVLGFGTAVRFIRREVGECEARDGVLPLSEESKRVVSEMTASSARAAVRPTIPIHEKLGKGLMQRLPFQFVSGRSSLPAVPVSRSRSVMVGAALSASCVLVLVTPATGVGPCDSVADAYARAQCVLGEMQAAGSVSPGNLAPNMRQTPQYGGAAGCTTSGCSGAPQEGYFSSTGDIAPLNAAATNATVMNPTYSTLQDQKSSKDGWDVSTTAPVKTAEAVATSITPSPGLSGTCVDVPTCVEYTAGPESVQTCQSPGVETVVCEVNTFVTITHKTQTGSFGPVGWCSDHYLYAQVRQIGPGNYSVEYLDMGPEGIWHKNCGHGGGWHVLGTFNYAASLGSGETILTESFSASISGWQNGGCTGFGSTTLGPGQSALLALCPAGGAQSGGIQMTLAYDVQVRKDVINDSCATLRSSWVFESSRCLDSAARQITSSDGTVFTIADVPCWREQEQWMTTLSSPDTCQPLLEKGCSQISSTCVPDSFGRCQVYENTFSCASTPICSRTVTMAQCNQCGAPGSYFPFCVDTSTPPNQYLALSATYLQLVKDVENDWDTTNLRVFNGTRMACDYNPIIRPIIDCCDASDPTRLLGSCSDEEVQLAKDRQLYKAHYVGTRCVEWVSFGFAKVCTRKEQVYCDFKSELARIVQEQGRAQLGWPWGSADAPDCSGFSITQFSSLNFATMDFTEWYVHVNVNIDPAAVASDMNAKICAYSGKC